MAGRTASSSKLHLNGPRVRVAVDEATGLATSILERISCDPETARMVAEHLVDADLSGVESHGLWRLLQYVDYFETGYLRSDAAPDLKGNGRGAVEVDGHGGIRCRFIAAERSDAPSDILERRVLSALQFAR